jgi:hypothetical protein
MNDGAIRHYHGETLVGSGDLRTGACCSPEAYSEDFRRLLERPGCADHRILARSMAPLLDAGLAARIKMVRFENITGRAINFPLEDRCEDYGQVASYRGSSAPRPHAFVVDDHHRLQPGARSRSAATRWTCPVPIALQRTANSCRGARTSDRSTARRWMPGMLLLGLLAGAASAAQPTAFSTTLPGAVLPGRWAVQPLPKVSRQTRFDLVHDGNITVLRARADDAAASLREAFVADPAKTPWLRWRWKTERVLVNADMAKKSGDDYSARLYVFFDRRPDQMSFGERTLFRLGRARFGEQLPAAALCYVWDNRQPVGTLRDNAYTGFVKMLVVTSGTARQGHWVDVQRDISADYRRAFGTEPPRITGVAVAVDTDNTGESTVSYFGDIRLEGAP